MKLKAMGGFTLVETLVGTVVLVMLALAVYQAYSIVIRTTIVSRAKIAATLLANEEIEIVRNLAFADVGVIGGDPNGKLPADQSLTRDGTTFAVRTTVQSVDDAYDGTAPGDPAPADYKKVQVVITCATCSNFSPVSFTTVVAP